MTAARDEQWLESVFSEYGKAIVKFLYRRGACAEAEDLAAETLVVLWRKGDEVPDGAELPWLYKTTGLTPSNRLRKKKSLPLGDAIKSLDSADSSDPASLVMENQGIRIVLAELSERDREVILAVAWGGLTGQALVDYPGVSRNTAGVALSWAWKRLEEAIAWNT